MNKTDWWVEQVLDITRNQREKKYAHPLINFLRAAEGLNFYLRGKLQPGMFINPVDAAYMMVLWKVAREMNAHNPDNGIDVMGYVDCHNRIDVYMRELGYEQGAQAFRSMTESEMIALRVRLEGMVARGEYPETERLDDTTAPDDLSEADYRAYRREAWQNGEAAMGYTEWLAVREYNSD